MIQDTRYKIQDTRYKIRDTRYKIQDTRCLPAPLKALAGWFQDSAFEINPLEFTTLVASGAAEGG